MKPCSSLLAAAGILFLLTACQKESLAPPSDAAVGARGSAQPADRCLHFTISSTSNVGFVCLPAPLNVCGLGALPNPVTIGGISGYLSSAAGEQRNSGNGAIHFVLYHYFDDGNGNTFWTEDRAVCAPAGTNPLACTVHDVLTVAGGTGIFAQASGSLRNHGTFDLAAGTLGVNMRGRICGDGL